MEKNNVEKRKITLSRVIMLSKRGIIAMLCVIFAILAFHGMKVRKDSEFIPSIFGHTYLNVLTGSMDPELKVYDLAIGKKIDDNDKLEIGDIITFKDGNILVTHRIVEVLDNKVYKTKGDANAYEDDNLVERSNIVSLYKFKIPNGGYVVAKFQDFLFLALVWAILTYYIIKELLKEIKKHKLEKTDIQ